MGKGEDSAHWRVIAWAAAMISGAVAFCTVSVALTSLDQVLGAAPRPRFGFEYVRDGRGTVVGYGVRPEEMEVVARIFEMLAGGESIHGVRAALEGEGVEAPGGGARWSRTTIKNVAKDDVYMPREVGELVALVAEGLMDDAILSLATPRDARERDHDTPLSVVRMVPERRTMRNSPEDVRWSPTTRNHQ